MSIRTHRQVAHGRARQREQLEYERLHRAAERKRNRVVTAPSGAPGTAAQQASLSAGEAPPAVSELLPRPQPQIGRHACERWLQRVEPLEHLRHDVALQLASASIAAIVEEGEEVDADLMTLLPPHRRPPIRYFRDRNRPQVVVPVDPRSWTAMTVLVVGPEPALQEAIR